MTFTLFRERIYYWLWLAVVFGIFTVGCGPEIEHRVNIEDAKDLPSLKRHSREWAHIDRFGLKGKVIPSSARHIWVFSEGLQDEYFLISMQIPDMSELIGVAEEFSGVKFEQFRTASVSDDFCVYLSVMPSTHSKRRTFKPAGDVFGIGNGRYAKNVIVDMDHNRVFLLCD